MWLLANILHHLGILNDLINLQIANKSSIFASMSNEGANGIFSKVDFSSKEPIFIAILQFLVDRNGGVIAVYY